MQQGGTLALGGSLNISGNTVSGGRTYSGTPLYPSFLANGGGKAFGSGLFLQGNGSFALAPSAGQMQTISDIIADQTGVGGTGKDAGAWQLVKNGAGTTILTGANVYSGGTTINAGVLQGNTASLIGNITTTLRSSSTRLGRKLRGHGLWRRQPDESGAGALTITGRTLFWRHVRQRRDAAAARLIDQSPSRQRITLNGGWSARSKRHDRRQQPDLHRIR